MKIKADSKNITEAVRTASRACPTRSPMEVLQSVLVRAEGSVHLTGTNTQTFVDCSLECEVNKPGTCLLPPSAIQLIPRLEGQVAIETNDSGILISSGKSRFKINTMKPEIHPAKKIDQQASYHAIDSEDLSIGIQRVRFAADPRRANTAFGGVAISCMEDGSCLFAAMDGKRIAIHSLKGESFGGHSSSMQSTVLDADAMKIVGLTLSSSSKDIAKLHAGVAYATIESGSATCGIPLLEGRFPDVRKLLKPYAEGSAVCRCLVSEMLAAARTISIFLEKESRGIDISINDNALIMSKFDTGSESDVFLEVDGEGECDAIINASFLIDWLASLKQDEFVEMCIPPKGVNGFDMAVVLKSGDSTYLISPMVVDSET